MLNWRRADGLVLVVVMLATLLVSALVAALVVSSASETMIADSFHRNLQAFHAADAAAERAMADLAPLASWDAVLDGSLRSAFADGPPSGARALADGSTIDLSQVANLSNCHTTSPCSPATMDAVTSERPWGANNPRWQLYAYGRLTDSVPTNPDWPYYSVVLVGDDPSEDDGDPLRDGAGTGGHGAGVVMLRSEAFGPRRTHKVVELVIRRREVGRISIVSWRAIS